MILIVEACATFKTKTGTFAGLGLWITVQAIRLNLLKAQLQGAEVPVHYHVLQCQDLALSCISRKW